MKPAFEVTLITCLLGAVACGGHPATERGTGVERVTHGAPPGPAVALRQIELLDTGRAPRVPLRYQLHDGTRDPYFATAEYTSYNGAVRTCASMELTVEKVDAEGGADLDVAVDTASVQGYGPASHGRWHIDARGESTATSSGSMIVPFPVEAVGVGARWRVHYEPGEESWAAYELLEVTPTGARLRKTTREHYVGTQIGNMTNVTSDTITETDGELVVAWASVVPHGHSHVTVHGTSTVTVDDFARGGTGPPSVHQDDSTREESLFPAHALTPPAFFPGDVGPALVMLLPAVTPPLCVAPDGPLTGPFTSRWPEGPLAVEGMCQTGQPEGDWSWRDEHGDVISRGHFLHGRPTGEWTQLYQGKRLGSFTMADGTGVAVSWWPSGAKRLEVGFVNGVADGDVASWRADGTRELEGHIAKGRGHGYFTSYDAKGRVTSKVALPNGYTPP